MRRLCYVMAAAGLTLLGFGVVLLGVELSVFRWTTQDLDFTGLTCGTPLDHPNWKRGEPCHGAINRQTAVAFVALLSGAGALAGALILFVQSRGADKRAP
jgi:hypothetical protein